MQNEQDFWQIFVQTGEPMAYLFYKSVPVECTKDYKESDICSSIKAFEVS